jgi:hypothetical protein
VLPVLGPDGTEPLLGESGEGVVERRPRPARHFAGGNPPLEGYDAPQGVGYFGRQAGVGQVEDVAVKPLGEEDFLRVFFALCRLLKASTKGVRMVA